MGTQSHRAQPHKTSLLPFCKASSLLVIWTISLPNKVKFKQNLSSPTAALFPWEFSLKTHLFLLPFAVKIPSLDKVSAIFGTTMGSDGGIRWDLSL